MKHFAKSLVVDYIVKPTIAYYAVTKLAETINVKMAHRGVTTPPPGK